MSARRACRRSTPWARTGAWPPRELQCPLSGSYFDRFAAAMGDHAGASPNFYFAQCVKDETMGESVAETFHKTIGRVAIVHFDGAFHSDFGEGTAESARRRMPGRRIAVVSILPVADIDAAKPADADLKRADYLVYTTKNAVGAVREPPLHRKPFGHLGDDVGHHGDRGRRAREVERIDLVDRVGRRVVDAGNSSRPPSSDSAGMPACWTLGPMSAPPPLGPMASVWMPASSVAMSRTRARARFGAAETEPRRAEHAAVGFQHHHVIGELGEVLVAVRLAAAPAVLLVGPQHDADGAPRAEVQLLHQPQRFPRRDAPAAIVGRPRADVPRIEVPADDDHFVRQLAAADLADDVRGVGVGEEARLHHQLQPDRRSAIHHPLQTRGVLGRHGGGRESSAGRPRR